MVKELSVLDIVYLMKELSVFNNSKIDRIYHTKEKNRELIIVVHVSGQGKQILRFILPSIMFIDHAKDDQGIATGLCMMLRKNLEGAILESIIQKGFERVIELKIRNKEQKFYLIIELFGKGNIIFCNEEYQILNILESQKWKDRTIERNEKYVAPHSEEILAYSQQQFIEKIKNSKKESIVKALATDLSLGGKYAEELCMRSNINKSTKISELATNEFITIYEKFREMLDMKLEPYSHEGNIYPFKFLILKELTLTKHQSFNDAIVLNIEFVDETQKKVVEQQKKYQNIISEQEKILSEAVEGYENNQLMAETIYKQYQEIDDIIKTIREARKKYGWKEIETKISSNPEHNKKIISVDEKNHSVTIKIKD